MTDSSAGRPRGPEPEAVHLPPVRRSHGPVVIGAPDREHAAVADVDGDHGALERGRVAVELDEEVRQRVLRRVERLDRRPHEALERLVALEHAETHVVGVDPGREAAAEELPVLAVDPGAVAHHQLDESSRSLTGGHYAIAGEAAARRPRGRLRARPTAWTVRFGLFETWRGKTLASATRQARRARRRRSSGSTTRADRAAPGGMHAGRHAAARGARGQGDARQRVVARARSARRLRAARARSRTHAVEARRTRSTPR